MQAMSHGDGFQPRIGRFGVRSLRFESQQLNCRRVEIQLTRLNEFQNSHRGEWLGNTCNAEKGLRLDGQLLFPISQAIPTEKNQTPILEDCECPSRNTSGAHEFSHLTPERLLDGHFAV